MRANDPLFEGTTAIELWRHDDDDDNNCHIALYYRSNGEREVYEMRLDDRIIPLHPEFPMGFAMAAHCLLHIGEDLYAGRLIEKPTKDTNLLEGWEG